MCGISGVYYFNSKKADKRFLKSMNDKISHRGPDDSGYHIDNNVGLAHARLSIIDLKTGNQPISNGNKTITVIYNGEIYMTEIVLFPFEIGCFPVFRSIM